MASKRDFVVVKGQVGQADCCDGEEHKKEIKNEIVGFRCLRYSVTEGSGKVHITIQKKVSQATVFGVRTVDDTAKAG